uniref:Protein-arginine deiminase (PAD) n=1 Tax=Candidatus Kentrum sp. LPFa TaxID=2126335 RepID=A0A450WCW8_9GAMM|nr:MAG: Protein-arginine deiminase (PAD) [Candidatus Kentron sp. LPFa]VFK24513.1 MAG: Protein-arginine deiminase (PAD) [Candidatus Kentron sp. LPFa]
MLNSPRNRSINPSLAIDNCSTLELPPAAPGLCEFAEEELWGPDFGYFQIVSLRPGSLDSFGNLEVSPPLSVNNKEYPFGRIILGGKKPGGYASTKRQMTSNVRQFVYAQKVQSPIEIYTDWLLVGHVDEIFSFIPDYYSSIDGKKFKLLVASPSLCVDALKELDAEGHGDVVMFKGKKKPDSKGKWISAEITIGQLLSETELVEFNIFDCQKNIDINKAILKKELGLDDDDFIEIPVLFNKVEYSMETIVGTTDTIKAVAYFPDMVNHLVLGDYSLAPKPHGPVINGKDYFEKMMEKALPIGRLVRFIEDWNTYHAQDGEVHCGTNALRRSFEGKPWWIYMPDGGFDI